jgi:SM-20-related protein
MISTLSQQDLERLNQDDFVVFNLRAMDCEQLKIVAKKLYIENLFHSAKIGESLSSKDKFQDIRNDLTFWIDRTKLPKSLTGDESKIISNYCVFLDKTLNDLKIFFRMSINSFETHFAVYPKGHYYKRHTDQSKQDNKRIFSFVIYLNSDWKDSDGGNLIGYKNEQKIFDCPPKLGTMILFLSSLEHEVRPANRERYSITGWFRND